MFERIRPEEVNIVVPAEGITLALSAVLEPGDHVVAVDPAYQSLSEIAIAEGCDVALWRPREEGNGFRFFMDDAEALLRADTKLVVANFPHNPTGAVLSAADLQRLCSLCAARGARLFNDEIYRGLETAARISVSFNSSCRRRRSE